MGNQSSISLAEETGNSDSNLNKSTDDIRHDLKKQISKDDQEETKKSQDELRHNLGQKEKKGKQSSHKNLEVKHKKKNDTDKILDKLRNKGEYYEFIVQMLEGFLGDLKVPKDQQSSLTLELWSLLKPRTFNKGAIIFNKGDTSEAVYFIQTGSVEELSESVEYQECSGDCAVLSVLRVGQYFNEVPALWELKCTSTAKAREKTVLMCLPVEGIQKYCSGITTVFSLEDWYISHRYIPTVPDVKSRDVMSALTLQLLTKVPLFHAWEQPALAGLVQELMPFPVTLYPPDSYLTVTGDPGGQLLVLMAGELEVFTGDSDNKRIATFRAKVLPFVIGEQGLFQESWHHQLTAISSTTSRVISVPSAVINSVLDKQASNSETKKMWEITRKQWRDVSETRDPGLYIKHPQLQSEILYTLYRENSRFAGCTPGCVYTIARCSVAWCGTDTASKLKQLGEDSVVYVYQEDVKFVNPKSRKRYSVSVYSAGTVFSIEAWMLEPWVELHVLEETIVVVTSADLVQYALDMYPPSNLNKNPTSSHQHPKAKK